MLFGKGNTYFHEIWPLIVCITGVKKRKKKGERRRKKGDEEKGGGRERECIFSLLKGGDFKLHTLRLLCEGSAYVTT